MPTPFKAMLFFLSEIAKENHNQEPSCPTCGERYCIIKHGFYRRYLFYGSEMIPIQRHCCGNPLCDRRTFSCLPHPFLPLIRLPLCALKALLDMVRDFKMSIAAVARALRMHWPTVNRALQTGRKLFAWLGRQAAGASWRPSACLDPDQHWQEFIISISYAFYPDRF
ncbi:MAG: hypothetical protein DRP52_06790 [Planctomycetota bacterium]|nr:MAG: hypothetical protein DRP52_06790 [Planctomycetota bacterium]